MKHFKHIPWIWDLIVVILFFILIIAMSMSLAIPQRGGWLVLITFGVWIGIHLLRKKKIAWHQLLLLGIGYGVYLMIPKSNEAAVPMYYLKTSEYWMVLVYIWLIYDTTGGYFKREHWENALLILGGFLVFQMVKELVYWYWTYHLWSGSLTFEPPNMAYRVSGGFASHPNHLAAFLNAIWPLVLLRVIKPSKIWIRIAYATFLLLIFVVLITTNSRGGILGTIAMGGLIMVYAVLEKYPALLKKPTTLWSHISRRDKILMGIFLAVGLGMAGFIFWRVAFTGSQSAGFDSREQIWVNSIAAFLNSPLFGNGAGSFVPEYARAAGLPPGFMAPHAHNLEIQILVISGIVGLLFMLAGVLLALRFFYKIFQKTSGHERTHFVLLSMFLVGLLVHNQFDYSLEGSRPNTVVFIILIALVLNFDRQIQVARPRWAGTVVLGIFALSFFAALVGVTTVSKGQAQYTASLELVKSEEWDIAALSICDVADKNTLNLFYHFQCSQLKSFAGVRNQDEHMISEALEVQARALDANPWWPINRANYAGLLWWTEEYEHAFDEMQIAVAGAERNAVLYLNYGMMAERLGKTSVAESAYFSTMLYDPYMIGNPRYNQSVSWQVALDQIHQAIFKVNSWDEFMRLFPDAPFIKESSWALWRGLAAARTGDLEFGRQILRDQLIINPGGIGANVAAAYMFNELGDFEEASRFIEIARMSARRSIVNNGSFSPNTYWSAFSILGHILLENGKLHKAEELLVSSFLIVTTYNLSTAYNLFVYDNYTPLWDLSPTLEWGILSPELEADYQWLASKLEDDGDLEKAKQIRQWLEIQQANTLISH